MWSMLRATRPLALELVMIQSLIIIYMAPLEDVRYVGNMGRQCVPGSIEQLREVDKPSGQKWACDQS
jgi:hypothetical protein